MDPVTIAGAISLASQVANKATNIAGKAMAVTGQKSLVDVTSVARVEPITMIDADCVNIPAITDIVQSMQSLFAGYYLQAVNLMTDVGSVNLINRLAPLNPNRGLGFEDMMVESRKKLSMEEFKHRLPLSTHTSREVAVEAFSDKAIDSVKEAANLSVGKMYNVTVTSGPDKVTIPIAIRLMVNILPTRLMVELFTEHNAFDMSMKERYHAWRAGRLELINDLILCNDLVDKRVKSSIKDPSGVLSQINRRQSMNAAAGILSQKASVATASNIAILSTETLENVEMGLGGELSNRKVRSAIFEKTNLMFLCVVDKAWERVTIYTRGIETSTSLSFRELKTAAKGDSDVVDIMRALMMGNAPTL